MQNPFKYFNSTTPFSFGVGYPKIEWKFLSIFFGAIFPDFFVAQLKYAGVKWYIFRD